MLRLGERCRHASYPPSPHPPNSELPARCSYQAYCCIVPCTRRIMCENIPLLVGLGGRGRARGGGVKSAKLGRRLAPPPYRPPQYSTPWKYIVVVLLYVWACVHERNKGLAGQSGVNRRACVASPFGGFSCILLFPTSGPLRQLCCRWVCVCVDGLAGRRIAWASVTPAPAHLPRSCAGPVVVRLGSCMRSVVA